MPAPSLSRPLTAQPCVLSSACPMPEAFSIHTSHSPRARCGEAHLAWSSNFFCHTTKMRHVVLIALLGRMDHRGTPWPIPVTACQLFHRCERRLEPVTHDQRSECSERSVLAVLVCSSGDSAEAKLCRRATLGVAHCLKLSPSAALKVYSF